MTTYHCDRCGTEYSEGDAAFVGHAIHKPERCLETRLLRAERERDEARAKLNTPELHDFSKAVALEAAHQRERWGSEHDAGKSNADWFWLIGFLAGKALHAVAEGRTDKALHHVITTAAALANWHAAIEGTNTDMRPGIEPPRAEAFAEMAAERDRLVRAMHEIARMAGSTPISYGGSHDEQRAAIFNASRHAREGKEIHAEDYESS